MHWRRKWQPTPVFLPGESQGWGRLVGCHLWGRTESDTTEVTWRRQQQQQHVVTIFRPAAAAAESLQSCPTLCYPIDGSPLGTSVPGILQQEYWSGLPFPSPIFRPSGQILSLLGSYFLLEFSQHSCANCCCCSVPKSCSTLCDPTDCSTPSFPVFHHLPELAQTHVR